MARNKAHRKYQITINNPVEHGFTHEVIKTTLGTFANITYWCMCDEIGAEGTLHTHVYFASPNPIEWLTVHQRFSGPHIEGAKGSHRENRDYIRKEGKWIDDPKHETNLPDTFEESGELPPDTDKRQKQSEAVLAMVEDGASTLDVVRAFPSEKNHMNSIDALRQAILEEEYRNKFRELNVYYLWGKTGVGKTRFVMDKYGYENVYRVTNYAHPFDGYNCQPVILFDEFRSDLPTKDMLKYLEGYPLQLPCRYGDKVACYVTVFVISNIPMDKQYPNVQLDEPETWNAWLRRFNGGAFEMLPDCTDLPL